MLRIPEFRQLLIGISTKAVFTTQRDGWLRSLFRQREESGAGSSSHDDGQGALDGDSGRNVAHREPTFCVCSPQIVTIIGMHKEPCIRVLAASFAFQKKARIAGAVLFGMKGSVGDA